MQEELLKFKGADWFGMIFGLMSTYFVAKEKRCGFIYGVLCGLGWVTFGFLTHSVASILSNIFFILFNCYGFFRWKKKEEKQELTGC